MEARLREWRQEAVNKHQYETAICVADKLLAITGASHPMPFVLYVAARSR
jgi:anaphase-promoting complex subunit 6